MSTTYRNDLRVAQRVETVALLCDADTMRSAAGKATRAAFAIPNRRDLYTEPERVATDADSVTYRFERGGIPHYLTVPLAIVTDLMCDLSDLDANL